MESLDPSEQLYTFTLDANTAWYRVVSVAEEGEGGATQPRQAFRITPDVYRIDDASVPGIGFPTTLYGAVRYPTDLGGGPHPLVVMLHGNHGNCRDSPNDENDFCITTNTHDCPGSAVPPRTPRATSTCSRPSLRRASSRSASAATRSTAGTTTSSSGRSSSRSTCAAGTRGTTGHRTVWRHVRRRARPVARRIEGHSRGGDAIAHVHEVLQQNPIPGLTLRSLFAVAPTDYHQAVIPDSEYATLLPSCGGDVANHHGQWHYDRSIDLDDGAHRAQLVYIGGNHNFFNTEWRISEWAFFGNDPNCEPPPEPLKQEQTALLEGVLGSWFWTGLMHEDDPEPFIRADAPSPTAFNLWANADLEMRWSYSAPDRVLIDDFTDINAPATNALGGTNAFESWFLFEECYSNNCDPFFLHMRNVLRLLWEQGNVPLATFALEGYDASAYDMLSFRVVSRRSP